MDNIRNVQKAKNVDGDMIMGDKTVIISNKILKSSNLSKLITELAQIAPFKKASEKIDSRKNYPFDINDKIKQNSVKKYRTIINEYASYYDICDGTLNIIDGNDPNSKETLLRYVHNTYIIERDSILSGNHETFWAEIQTNADLFIDKVVEVFYCDLKDTDIYNICTIEDIKNMLNCFVVYCFMCCKILEEPIK